MSGVAWPVREVAGWSIQRGLRQLRVVRFARPSSRHSVAMSTINVMTPQHLGVTDGDDSFCAYRLLGRAPAFPKHEVADPAEGSDVVSALVGSLAQEPPG